MQGGPRYVIYARKSSESEDRQVLSIPAQIKELRELAARQGLEITEELTESYSAKEPGRPVFSRLLADVAKGKVPAILCWKLDRLSRNPVDAGNLSHYLGKGLLREIRCPDGVYTGSGDSRFMLSVLFGTATKYVDDLAVAVRRGNRSIHESGRITGLPPLGYMKLREPGVEGAGRVVPDPERFPLVQKLWLEALAGNWTVSELWRLARRWELTARGNRRFPPRPITLGHVYKIFESPFYAGRLERQGKTYRGEHRAMITEEQFARVQDRLRRRDAPRPSKHHLVYRGLLRCGACDRLFVSEPVTNRHGKTYHYYRCGRRRHGRPVCRATAIREVDVTASVRNALRLVSLDDDLLVPTLAAVERRAARERDGLLGRIREQQQELARIEHELKAADHALLQGILPAQRYHTIHGELAAREAALQETLREPTAEVEQWRQALREAAQFSTTVMSAFESGTDDERRSILGRLYSRITVEEGELVLRLKFPYSLLHSIAAAGSPTGDVATIGDIPAKRPRVASDELNSELAAEG
jgi:site-specific DNA recombinase